MVVLWYDVDSLRERERHTHRTTRSPHTGHYTPDTAHRGAEAVCVFGVFGVCMGGGGEGQYGGAYLTMGGTRKESDHRMISSCPHDQTSVSPCRPSPSPPPSWLPLAPPRSSSLLSVFPPDLFLSFDAPSRMPPPHAPRMPPRVHP